MASGNFVFFLNSDDRVLPGALNRLSTCAAERPEVLIWTGGTRIFSHTQENREVTIRTIDSSECTELSLENVLYDTPLLSARFIHRSVFLQLGNIDPSFPMSSDREFMLRCALSEVLEASLGIRVSELRMHKDSTTMHGGRRVVPPYLIEHLLMADKWL